MREETPNTRLPDLSAELAAFNAAREKMLGGKPIDPEGVVELMPEEMDR